jgi:hypothetical protein
MTVFGPAAHDALRRVDERASDVLGAYVPGAMPRRADVRGPAQPLPSDDPLSVALPPDAWLVTVDARGARSYTRAGGLRFDADGVLRDGAAAVLGYAPDAPDVPFELRLPELDRTLGRCGDVRIESDGTLAYTRASIDPRTRERTVERVAVARLALARFPAGSEPTRIDATRVAAPEGVVPHLGRPADGTFGPLATAARDGGSLDLDAGLARLSEAYLAVRALHAAQRADARAARVATDLVK